MKKTLIFASTKINIMKKVIFAAILIAANMSVSAQNITKFDKQTIKVSLKNGKLMYLDFYGENIFRLFEDPNGGQMRAPKADPEAQILVDNPRKEVALTIDGNTIKTAKLTVKIDPNNGAINANGLNIGSIEFDKGRTTLKIDRAPAEYFYGGGVQNGRFSHSGKIIAIENTNNWVDGGVASPTPFYWSTCGYGVMGYTFAPGKYDFGATEANKVRLMHETDYADYFFMFDEGAVALLNDFYQLTGNPVLLPKFGFYEGHLNAYNRDYWTEAETGKRGYGLMQFEDGKTYRESQKDDGGIKESLNGEKNNYMFSARAAIDRYIKNDMPLGWFLPNDGYGAGYGQTGTLEGNVQNLKEFGEYARSKGVEIGLWTQSDLHPKEGVEALLQRDIVREVRDAGVRVLKTDVAWVGAGYSFGLNGVADVGKIMPQYGNDARPFIISLDGWAGTQRYAGIWSGDQTGGEWEYIRFHIPTYIGSGLSGQPNITSDMDGIFGGQNVPVNIRDFQWKTYTPMQLNMDGWGSNEKYPFALGEPATSINRNYLKLKSILMPYTYSIAHEAIDGKPMIRAMFLEDNKANEYVLGSSTQYQFMYGPYILVTPIYKNTRAHDSKDGVKDGDDVRDGIYLPEGLWMDAYDGKIYEGGRIINDFDAPLWKMPTFVKTGAIIPITEAHNTPNKVKNDLLKIFAVPGQKNSFELYDDDGKTEAYLKGEYSTTLIESELNAKGKFVVKINPTKGNFVGNINEKTISLVVPISDSHGKVVAKVDGKKVPCVIADAKEPTIFAQNMQEQNANIPFVKQLYVILESKVDISKHNVTIEIDKIKIDSSNPDLTKTGPLSVPNAIMKKENARAYDITPSWETVENADYYEIEFGGQIYSTIRDTQYTVEGLTPEKDYSMKVRSVNAQGKSDWADVSASTTADPLQWAIRGVRGETSCANQGGAGIRHLFDFDESSMWHTDWNVKAVPFTLTIDLHSVNTLDKLLYYPRENAGNGNILEGTIQVSMDKQNWSDAVPFSWRQDASVKEIDLTDNRLHTTDNGQVRYIRFNVTKAVGDFGSGRQMYIFRKANSDFYIPGDINQDGRIDENDLTSYYNYTGLRRGDSDFGGYVEKGDLNNNGLIDAYDISAVGIELESGVSSKKVDNVAGKVSIKQSQTGSDIYLTITGKDMKSVNAVSMCIPYDPKVMEYVGIEAKGVSQMYNMTYDRLHTNGNKALYPTFVNIGEQTYTEGNQDLFVIHFKTKNGSKVQLKATDGMLVDKYLNTVKF